MLPLLLLSALLAAASGQAALEPYMLGKFELESSNGFEDFMTEIGVGFLTRKVCGSVVTISGLYRGCAGGLRPHPRGHQLAAAQRTDQDRHPLHLQVLLHHLQPQQTLQGNFIQDINIFVCEADLYILMLYVRACVS